ncbi:heavy metal translocating P-type ATPase [Shewanella intestini]|uniref:heavy metal translocating P-type ATPase n=1 Tax=Shewanella TaxID=22 RepID=UPI001E4DC382|nr:MULTISPECIES: heavy metal translocating P-type ATPase [Shewanella]
MNKLDQSSCFHCHEPIAPDLELTTTINKLAQPMCCLGCQAVSQAIVDADLVSYYQFRTEPGQKGSSLIPEQLQQYSAYDLVEVQQDFVYNQGDTKTISLTIDGISCAACAWLIEHKINSLKGIESIMVNSTTQRALISWYEADISLSEILNQINKVGYQAAPYQVDEQEKIAKANSRKFLLRLGLAGFATMQVMMFALALYSEYFTDLEQEYRDYFRWVSMIFAAPVVFYSAQPFYFSAIRSLLSGRLNMDFSVSLAIVGAYIASMIATINGNGEVYFESVSMFTFFLLLGRYFEQAAKRQASISSSNLHKRIPITANKIVSKSGLDEQPQTQQIAAKQLKINDVIWVKPGEMIAADGMIINGDSCINESMLTGEHLPVDKGIDQPVYAGTVNISQPIEIKITAVGQDQLVAEIIRLQEIASNTKPKVSLLAERAASYFSSFIIAIATLTYLVWYFLSPEDAFWVTLSVLVATCPCALALATPTAITCATDIFTKMGLITRQAGVFEKLPLINHVVFDKTGTLTYGNQQIEQVSLYDTLSQLDACRLAASLEQSSHHPIAKAFVHFECQRNVSEISHHVGQGISGVYRTQLIKLGSKQFVTEVSIANHGTNIDDIAISEIELKNGFSAEVEQQTKQRIYLSIDNKLQAQFTLTDSLREDSAETIKQLHANNISTSIASGDNSGHVDFIGSTLSVGTVKSGLTPQQKLAYIQQLQTTQHVAMFGDGINDAPVLAGANLSVAMGSGTALAQNSADLILLGDNLLRFNQAIKIAKKTQRIINQNLAWALGYNVLIIPLAVTGHVLPYIAAIGMSLSSLIVVSNSLRLSRIKI